jgi:hypothetical protein
LTVRRLAVIGCDTENKEAVTIIKSSESVVKCQKLSRVGTQFLGGYSSLKGGVSFARFLSKNGSEAWGVSMVLIIREAVTPEQINQMTEQFGSNLIKLAVDVKREIVAGGGELHSDCEQALLEDGSQQIDVWRADWQYGLDVGSGVE